MSLTLCYRTKELQVMKEMLQDREKRLEKACAERREAELKLDHMTLKASVSIPI